MKFVGQPKLLDKTGFMGRVSSIIDSQVWGNNGFYVEALEAYLAEYLGCHCVAVSNATIGLKLATKAYLETIYGSNLSNITCLMQSYTFVAAATIMQELGISVKYADIDNSYCLNPKELEEPCQWEFVLGSNLFGNLSDKSLYGSNTYPTVWDNAHGLGVYNEFMEAYVGADCDISVFSLHPTKFCGSGECGIITCKDPDLAKHLREVRNFGYQISGGGREGTIKAYGTNAKITEIQSAMSLTQLESIQEIQEHYYNIHMEYERLAPDLIKPKNNLFSNWSYVVTEVNNRESVINSMNKDGIYPRSYFKPLHHINLYRDDINLPNTDRLAERTLCLPTGLSVNTLDVQYIVNSLRRAINESR